MVKVPDETVRRIRAHCEHTYPEECCGMMLGVQQDGTQSILEIVEIDNSQDDNRGRRFLISPLQYREAERHASELGMELLGFYHSHPDHPAIPSAFDTEHALPWFTYIIVSVIRGQADNITAWLLSEDRTHFDSRELLIDPATLHVPRS